MDLCRKWTAIKQLEEDQAFKKGITDEQLLKSRYLVKACLQYPYSFQLQQRKQWLRKQELKLHRSTVKQIDKEQMRKFIVISLLEKDGGTRYQQKKVWVVDKSSMQIYRSYPRPLGFQQLLQIQKQFVPMKNQVSNPKIANLLFIGRFLTGMSEQGKKLVSIPHQQVSHKHLVISKQSNPESNLILTFLLCAQNKHNPSRLLSKLPQQLIRNIVRYLGTISESKYLIKDNRSSNGTQFYPQQPYPLCKEKKQLLLLDSGYGVALEFENIVRKSKLTDVKTNLDYAIANYVRNKNIQICNRNIGYQKQLRQFSQILLLKQVTQHRKRLHVLYSQQAPYVLVLENGSGVTIRKKTAQDKLPEASPGHNQYNNYQKNYGEVYFDGQQGWKIKPYRANRLYINLNPEVQYALRQKNHLRLGKNVWICIQCNTKPQYDK